MAGVSRESLEDSSAASRVEEPSNAGMRVAVVTANLLTIVEANVLALLKGSRRRRGDALREFNRLHVLSHVGILQEKLDCVDLQ